MSGSSSRNQSCLTRCGGTGASEARTPAHCSSPVPAALLAALFRSVALLRCFHPVCC